MVVTCSFGYFIWGSISYLLTPGEAHQLTNENLIFILIYESVVLAFVFWFLRNRDWKFSDFNILPSAGMTGIGFGLALFNYYLYYILFIIAAAISPKFYQLACQPAITKGNASLGLIVLVSLFNPLFEEMLVVGYLIPAIEKLKNLTIAINTSVAIRLLYHLYQGPIAAVFIVPMGLIFAYWYAHKRNLWPLIVAHAIGDFVGFMNLR